MILRHFLAVNLRLEEARSSGASENKAPKERRSPKPNNGTKFVSETVQAVR